MPAKTIDKLPEPKKEPPKPVAKPVAQAPAVTAPATPALDAAGELSASCRLGAAPITARTASSGTENAGKIGLTRSGLPANFGVPVTTGAGFGFQNSSMVESRPGRD